MKTYIFIYLTKKNDELRREEHECHNINDARKLAATLAGNVSHDQFKKITVKKK